MAFGMSPLDSLRHFKHWAVNKWADRDARPAWTSPKEQQYLRAFACSQYTGRGEIVDLGCMLGATTFQLAAGLCRNPKISDKDGRIHAYDLFRWHSPMEALPIQFKRHYSEGDSFLEEFNTRLRRYRNYVRAYPGDITEIGWHGAPIEFLMVDANKSWGLCDFIFKAFFPRLLVGGSQVLEQDFKHYYTPWIHLLHYRLRGHFVAQDLEGTCSVIFRLMRPLSPCITTDNLSNTSSEELEEAYAYSLSLLKDGKGWEQSNVLASKVMFYIHQSRFDEARDALRSIVADGYTLHSDLATCEHILHQIRA